MFTYTLCKNYSTKCPFEAIEYIYSKLLSNTIFKIKYSYKPYFERYKIEFIIKFKIYQLKKLK